MKKIKLKIKKIVCILLGHKWKSTFSPSGEINKPVQQRTFCKRCGTELSKKF